MSTETNRSLLDKLFELLHPPGDMLLLVSFYSLWLPLLVYFVLGLVDTNLPGLPEVHFSAISRLVPSLALFVLSLYPLHIVADSQLMERRSKRRDQWKTQALKANNAIFTKAQVENRVVTVRKKRHKAQFSKVKQPGQVKTFEHKTGQTVAPPDWIATCLQSDGTPQITDGVMNQWVITEFDISYNYEIRQQQPDKILTYFEGLQMLQGCQIQS